MTEPQLPPNDAAAQYIGLTVEEAEELAQRENRLLRVLAPGAYYTMEFIENRVNVTAVNGVVVRVTVG